MSSFFTGNTKHERLTIKSQAPKQEKWIRWRIAKMVWKQERPLGRSERRLVNLTRIFCTAGLISVWRRSPGLVSLLHVR